MNRIDVETEDQTVTTAPKTQATAAGVNKLADRGRSWLTWQTARRIVFGVVIPVAILYGGFQLANHVVQTGPTAVRRHNGVRNARLVEIQTVHLSKANTLIHAMGTVQPARRVELRPRVSGEIIEISRELIPGGLLGNGDTVLQIDRDDYELALRQHEGELASAESRYQLELGNQSIALREYELLGETILEEDRDLVLRRPQLKTVEAALDIARAALAKAQLELDRTTIRAPFNAMIESRAVNLGAQVNPTTPLAVLVGTDEYWIELSVAVDELKWIRIPRSADEQGSPVRIFNEAAWGSEVFRVGRVIRLVGALEEQGRMARLIVAVHDPVSLADNKAGAPALLIDSFVRAEVEGVAIDGVVAVERRLLRDGDQVWILDGENRLETRPVTVAFRGRGRVLVCGGIAAGERLITTDLATPVAGMPLRIREGDEPSAAGSPPSGGAGVGVPGRAP